MNRLIVYLCIFSKFLSYSFCDPICDASTLIHVRTQGQSKYVFYVYDNELRAVVVKNDVISGDSHVAKMPHAIVNDIVNGNVDVLAKMLDHSFFSESGMKVRIHARGYGGWNEVQHRGYKGGSAELVSWLAHEEGTYIWAQDIFELFSCREDRRVSAVARLVADACAAVETDVATKPLNLLDFGAMRVAQGWHFNVNDCEGGTYGDSRLILAIEQISKAVELFKNGCNDESLVELGRGLHPLQDIFAHTDAFVSLYRLGSITFLAHLGDLGVGADDPFYIDRTKHSYRTAVVHEDYSSISQRYSDAKTASYIYLYCYKIMTEDGFDDSLDVFNKIKRRLSQSLAAYDVDSVNYSGVHFYKAGSPRGTHVMYYLINSLWSALAANECSDVKKRKLYNFWLELRLAGNSYRASVTTRIPVLQKPLDLEKIIDNINAKTWTRHYIIGPINIENFIKIEEAGEINESSYSGYYQN